MSIYRYKAIIKQEDGIYTVEFPAFQIRGRGFSDHAETVEFAKDLLAEIVLAYRKESKELPLMPDPAAHGSGGGAPTEEGVLIEVDAEQYGKKADANRKRVFYEFESDEDVISPAGRKKYLIPAAAAVFVIIVIAAVLLLTGR